MSTEQQETNFEIVQDGEGVIVKNLPGAPADEQPQQEASSNASEPLGDQSGDDDDDDDDNGRGQDVPGQTSDEREAIREARRQERQLKKQFRRAKNEEDNRLINTLRRQNEQMAERLAVLEKRTAGSDLARVDKAIEDSSLRLHYAKLKIKEATETADGAALAEANEAWYESRRQLEALQALKKKVVENNATPRQAVPTAPDPLLKRHATEWMSRNSWYDPNGDDMDSKIATKVDEALVAEGWDPTTSEYWTELDKKLTKYLPHRYNTGREQSSNRGPRSVVTGSGREQASSSKPGEFRLSPERVRAIKEAGKWDNIAERNRMIKKYAEYDRTNNRG